MVFTREHLGRSADHSINLTHFISPQEIGFRKILIHGKSVRSFVNIELGLDCKEDLRLRFGQNTYPNQAGLRLSAGKQEEAGQTCAPTHR
jgi:hypothetical protein